MKMSLGWETHPGLSQATAAYSLLIIAFFLICKPNYFNSTFQEDCLQAFYLIIFYVSSPDFSSPQL